MERFWISLFGATTLMALVLPEFTQTPDSVAPILLITAAAAATPFGRSIADSMNHLISNDNTMLGNETLGRLIPGVLVLVLWSAVVGFVMDVSPKTWDLPYEWLVPAAALAGILAQYGVPIVPELLLSVMSLPLVHTGVWIGVTLRNQRKTGQDPSPQVLRGLMALVVSMFSAWVTHQIRSTNGVTVHAKQPVISFPAEESEGSTNTSTDSNEITYDAETGVYPSHLAEAFAQINDE